MVVEAVSNQMIDDIVESIWRHIAVHRRTGESVATFFEYKCRDENMHVIGMTKLFREYCREHPRIVSDDFKQQIYQMYRDAVKLEDKVIDLSFEMGDIEGLSASQMKQYIRYIADRRLLQLGMKPNFKEKNNPLPWLDWVISGDSFKNFFEGTVTDYSNAGMEGDWDWPKIIGKAFDEDKTMEEVLNV